jgi:cell division protein FtsB
MADQPARRPFDVEQLVAELEQRVERQRAAGAYADDLSGIALQTLPLSEDTSRPRVQFRPELGFSSKPVIGPVITLVKRLILRLQFYVFDDLARQADKAVADVEARLAAEIATRERLEDELEAKVRALEDKIRLLEDRAQR